MMKTTLIAALALSAAATPLLAEDGPGPGGGERGGQFFEMLDADDDGQVTQAEIDTQRSERFAEVDADGDGAVTKEEFTTRAAARATERAEAMFERLDADGDGALSRDTLEAGEGRGPLAGRLFARLDTDGDGAVAREEFDAAMERRADMRGRGHHGDGDRGHGFGHRRQ